MSDLEKELERWRNEVHGSTQSKNGEEYKSTMIHEVYSPKWKWFQPPYHWRIFGFRIFGWAYNIKRTVYTGVYPSAISGDVAMKCSDGIKINQVTKGGPGSVQTQIGIVFDGTCQRQATHPAVTQKAEEIMKKAEDLKKKADEMGIHLYGDAPDVSERGKKEGEDQC